VFKANVVLVVVGFLQAAFGVVVVAGNVRALAFGVDAFNHLAQAVVGKRGGAPLWVDILCELVVLVVGVMMLLPIGQGHFADAAVRGVSIPHRIGRFCAYAKVINGADLPPSIVMK